MGSEVIINDGRNQIPDAFIGLHSRPDLSRGKVDQGVSEKGKSEFGKRWRRQLRLVPSAEDEMNFFAELVDELPIWQFSKLIVTYEKENFRVGVNLLQLDDRVAGVGGAWVCRFEVKD